LFLGIVPGFECKRQLGIRQNSILISLLRLLCL